MIKHKKKFWLMFFVISISTLLFKDFNLICAASGNAQISPIGELSGEELEDWITSQMQEGNIPGLAVVITDAEQTLFQKGYGYADKEERKKTNPTTLFELGSNSKAFTGLAVIQLAEKGLVDLNAPVSRYLPWFQMHKKEETDQQPEMTVGHLLYHTSGIPFNSIKYISPAEDDQALSETVRKLMEQDLDSEPGKQFQYATINYDVLGLIVQEVMGQSYEEYIQNNILTPYGMNETFLFRDEAAKYDLATGYKMKFLSPVSYDAPIYRGNTPAGYIISNAVDVSKWLRVQMTLSDASTESSLIRETQLPDRTVRPAENGAAYAAGWFIYPKGSGYIAHGGSNPNYSSFMIVLPGSEVGIGVLSNINSEYTETIAHGIASLIQGEEPAKISMDTYQNLDRLMTGVIVVFSLLILLMIIFFGNIGKDFFRKNRVLADFRPVHVIYLGASICFLGVIGYCLYRLPQVMFWDLSWTFLKVWAPDTLLIGTWLVAIFCCLLNIYLLAISIFNKKGEKPLLLLILLSSISGFGNALIIFAVTKSISRINDFSPDLFIYFVLGIIVYVVGQRIIRQKMIKLTNDLVYEKRSGLIDNILSTPFYKFEKLNTGEIFSVLKGDTEIVSNSPNIFIGAVTNVVTLVLCFIYLGIISWQGLLLSVSIISIAVGLYYLMGRAADKLWERTRDIQNRFFNYINDMVRGFKELKLNSRRRSEFQEEMNQVNLDYRDKNVQAANKFTNAFVAGELLFVIVIGSVAFLFPHLFDTFKQETLVSYVFVFLYMTGPVNGVLGLVPQIVRIRISWKRINNFVRETDSGGAPEFKRVPTYAVTHASKLSLDQVRYEYKNDDKRFQIGPISHEFNTGEITFITGGNGSGKTTLAKLITGLYKADEGKILMNGSIVMDHMELGDYFAQVFSDFYLFKKLYGLEITDKQEQIEDYLNVLQMKGKVELTQNEISTLDLSTGQRKRLALLISYLEDKSFYLFDEWAADQDPQFRQFFYEQLLPELKNRGKCVIAITHDDRFFHLADHVIKMNFGKAIDDKLGELSV